MSRNTGTDMERGHEIEAKNMHKMLRIFDENMNCIFCMQLADRPVTVGISLSSSLCIILLSTKRMKKMQENFWPSSF